MLSTCLMVSSLHASKEDSYYQAYAQLQAALALPSATFDGPTVRAAAVAAFHAEQRRRSLPLLVRPILCWRSLVSPVFAARPLVLLLRRLPAAAALITASCRVVRSVLFCMFALSKTTSPLCPTATPSPTSPIKPSKPTKLTRLRSRIHTVHGMPLGVRFPLTQLGPFTSYRTKTCLRASSPPPKSPGESTASLSLSVSFSSFSVAGVISEVRTVVMWPMNSLSHF